MAAYLEANANPSKVGVGYQRWQHVDCPNPSLSFGFPYFRDDKSGTNRSTKTNHATRINEQCRTRQTILCRFSGEAECHRCDRYVTHNRSFTTKSVNIKQQCTAGEHLSMFIFEDNNLQLPQPRLDGKHSVNHRQNSMQHAHRKLVFQDSDSPLLISGIIAITG